MAALQPDKNGTKTRQRSSKQPAQVETMAMLYFCPTYTEDDVCLRHAKRGEWVHVGGYGTFSDQGLNRVGDHGG